MIILVHIICDALAMAMHGVYNDVWFADADSTGAVGQIGGIYGYQSIINDKEPLLLCKQLNEWNDYDFALSLENQVVIGIVF